MSEVKTLLCTMCCLRGIETTKLYFCRECGATCCPHFCRDKDDKRGATCDLCISKKEGRTKP